MKNRCPPLQSSNNKDWVISNLQRHLVVMATSTSKFYIAYYRTTSQATISQPKFLPRPRNKKALFTRLLRVNMKYFLAFLVWHHLTTFKKSFSQFFPQIHFWTIEKHLVQILSKSNLKGVFHLKVLWETIS